jgi:hypothetical protein
MGGGVFSVDASASRAAYRATTGQSAFTHDADARTGRAQKLHPTMDLTKKPLRESLDVPGKTPATPILVILDVTGSMEHFPGLIIKEMHKLGHMIAVQAVVTDPQLCFCAIGDARTDSTPVQVGEFEADDELAEQCLANIYLEGKGGGQGSESYDLMLYFAGHQTKTSAEDRGERGFMFIVGDEDFIPTVRTDFVQQYLGGDLKTDMSTEEATKKAQEKFDIFLIRPEGIGHYRDTSIKKHWESLLGVDHVLHAPEDAVLALIAGTISKVAGEDLDDIVASMKDSGFSASSINGAMTSLVAVSGSGAKTAEGLVAVGGGSSVPTATRL